MRTGILIGGLFAITLGGWAQASLPTDSSFTQSNLVGHLWLFTDSSNNLTINQIDTKRFYRSPDEQPNLGSDEWAHWLTFRCNNTHRQPISLVVEVDGVYFENVDFYVFSGAQLIGQSGRISYHTPQANRPIPSRYFAFPLTLSPGQTAQVFIRLRQKGGILLCPVTLWRRPDYEQHYTFTTLAFLVPLSVLGILTGISLFYWVISRRRILAYYALYTGGIMGFALNIEGFVAPYAPLPIASGEGWLICSLTAWVGSLLFTERFVFYRKAVPGLALRRYCFSGLTVFILVLLVGVIGLPFNGIMSMIALAISAFSPVFIFGWLLVGLYYHVPEARLYVVAALPVMLSALLIALAAANLLPNGDQYYLLFYFAPPVEVIILGVGIVQQFIREREQLLIRVKTTQAQLLDAQEIERQRLATDLHDDVGTSLMALRAQLGNNEPAEKLLDKILSDVRAVSQTLMPITLHDLGLPDALDELTQRLNSRPGVQFLFIQSGEPVPLDSAIDLTLYRLVQELMHTIIRSSQVTQAVIQLVYHEKHLNITIEDDKTDVDNRIINSSTDLNLKSLYSTVDWLKGQVAIDISQNSTTIRIDIPYPLAPDEPQS